MKNIHEKIRVAAAALPALMLFFAAAAAGAQSIITTNETFCQVLSVHTPAEGVNYIPGKDGKGNDVAPATIGGDEIKAVPDIIRMPLTLDLAGEINGMLPEGSRLPAGSEADALIGVVDIHADGKVFYNGTDISNQAHVLCESRDRLVDAPKKSETAAEKNNTQTDIPATQDLTKNPGGGSFSNSSE